MSNEISNDDDTELDDVEDSEDNNDDDDSMVDGVHEITVVDANVESLVARIDKTDQSDAARQREIRRKLEEANERREKQLDETFNFNIDEEF